MSHSKNFTDSDNLNTTHFVSRRSTAKNNVSVAIDVDRLDLTPYCNPKALQVRWAGCKWFPHMAAQRQIHGSPIIAPARHKEGGNAHWISASCLSCCCAHHTCIMCAGSKWASAHLPASRHLPPQWQLRGGPLHSHCTQPMGQAVVLLQ